MFLRVFQVMQKSGYIPVGKHGHQILGLWIGNLKHCCRILNDPKVQESGWTIGAKLVIQMSRMVGNMTVIKLSRCFSKNPAIFCEDGMVRF